MPKAYSIVGTQFTGTPESFMAELKSGATAVLVREPNNEFDKNAVAVWIDGRKVGYIPKKQNGALAQFIDQAGADVILNGTPLEAAKAAMGLDNALEQTRAITAKFIRSPNSNFPMVEV